jgi:hypothetical protein
MAKRTRLGKEFWERHLKQWRMSGKTQTLYCASAGLNVKTFNRWKLLFNKSKPQIAPASSTFDTPVSLIPVRLTGQESVDTSFGCVRDIRIRLDERQWTVDVPSGVDPKHLVNVLKAIAGVAQ